MKCVGRVEAAYLGRAEQRHGADAQRTARGSCRALL